MYRFMVLISILLATVANAMPRYLIVPMENVRFVHGPPQTQLHNRVQRSAWPQDEPAFAIPASIRGDDALAAASGLPGSPALAGPDYVDYGAYTGGYGAYGWYTDHPVLISGYH